jgi:putative ABC transport system permease protein
MLKNYFKITLRNIFRQKVYSFINIFGLAIGLTCLLLILLYINDELSYDNFHKNADRIYRVNTDLKFGPNELAIPLCSDMVGPIMKKDYPQIEEFTRVYGFGGDRLLKKGNEFINENGAIFADSTFFKVFSFPVLYGNVDHILNEPNTIVITEYIAKKYFGTIDAVGKYLETNDKDNNRFKITAVLKNIPANSHFNFNMIFPMHNLDYDWGNYVSSNMRTYFLLRPGVNYKEFESKFDEYNDKYAFPFAKKYMNIESKEAFKKAGNSIVHSLIPIKDIHLYSKRTQEFSPTGTIEYVYIFSAIAIFILIIACVNFMNLTTARSANRAREVGIRKVLGTQKKNLIAQFLLESVFMAYISTVFAIAFTFLLLPYFNEIAAKELDMKILLSPLFLLLLILLPVVVGIISGSYPALFLSRFMPAEIIKGKLSVGSKSGKLRSVLVVFQFVTSIVLIMGTIIVYKQIDFIQNKNLGYQKDQLLIINRAYLLNNIDAYKNEMLNTAGVSSATVTGFLPIPSSRNFTGFFKEASMGADKGMTMQRWAVDYDYIKTLRIKLIEGRNFSEQFGTDSSSAIINEAAVKQFGFTNPIGKKIYILGDGDVKGYNVIGIVKNFHYESMRQNIGGLCLVLGKNYERITLKINAANTSAVIAKAERLWKTMTNGLPFNYSFMDESFSNVYKAEQRVGKISFTFSLLAIVIACLGLFGLATFLAEQKTKEVGIRKVLGASIPSLLFMLLKEFLKWILIANLIAWPISYYFMNAWLQDYAYRVEISFWTFIISGGIALIVAIATVSFQAIKAATANPVDSLRYE